MKEPTVTELLVWMISKKRDKCSFFNGKICIKKDLAYWKGIQQKLKLEFSSRNHLSGRISDIVSFCSEYYVQELHFHGLDVTLSSCLCPELAENTFSLHGVRSAS